ncbi:MAG: hypothetical protein IJ719_20710 [Clostridia bacterium]|nr:hypothetical protein [Clostridia bacterium]
MSRINKETDYSAHQSFVMLETAKLLKLAGFDWEVLTFYQEARVDLPFEMDNCELHGIIEERDYNHFVSNKYNPNDREYFSAPPLAVAQRWLREVHHVSVEGGYARRTDNYVTIVIVPRSLEDLFGQNFEIGVQARDFSSYEEAVEWGIEFVLKALLKGGEQ